LRFVVARSFVLLLVALSLLSYSFLSQFTSQIFNISPLAGPPTALWLSRTRNKKQRTIGDGGSIFLKIQRLK